MELGGIRTIGRWVGSNLGVLGNIGWVAFLGSQVVYMGAGQRPRDHKG